MFSHTALSALMDNRIMLDTGLRNMAWVSCGWNGYRTCTQLNVALGCWAPFRKHF